ncbi:CHAT domain-containing protein [Mycena vulgaris]|nr:CHAT domain-containing protein [Mycena vulgaris]
MSRRTIVQQTTPMEEEHTQDSSSWKLKFDCEIPPHAPTFTIAILRKAQGTRLVGSIEIGQGEALLSGEDRKLFGTTTSASEPSGPCGSNIPGIQIGSVKTEDIETVLMQMFDDTGSRTQWDPQELWVMHERILLLPVSNENRGRLLNRLGNICLQQWKVSHTVDDLNQAVCAYDDAVRDGLADANSLHELGVALLHRVEQLGDAHDIAKCVQVIQAAVDLTPDSHPDKPSRLSNLAVSFVVRFERFGDLEDLSKSISMGEDAVCLTPDSHPDKPLRWSNLGGLFSHRFQQLGNLEDLNKSMLMREDAVRLTPDGHPGKPMYLNNLGNSLSHRFERFGDLEDLNKSVLMREDAVHLTPDGHPDKPMYLNNLAVSFLVRFERFGDLEDLSKSISMGEDAVCLTPDSHPDKPSRLNNLGNSFSRRFERLGDLEDLNKSVVMREDSVRLTPDGHPDQPSMFNNLGHSFLARFERLGDLKDLNRWPPKQAIHVEQSWRLLICVALSASVTWRISTNGHPDKPARLNNLGNSFIIGFRQLRDHARLQKAIDLYTLAACSTTGPATTRFHAASMWAQLAKILEHPSLMEAYNVALDLLPELAWLGLSISDRQYHLLKAGKLVRDAAAAAIVSGQAEKAVEWLEQGRSVIWGQLLNLRSPLDILSQSHPKLASRLLLLSAELEGSGTRESRPNPSESRSQQSPQSIADRAHQNAHERAELLKQIRGLEGFSRFFAARTLAELSQAAQQGPVVMLNLSDNRCDALILKPGVSAEVTHIPLTDFTPEDAQSLALNFSHLVGRGQRLHGQREGQLKPEDEFEQTLSKLWLGAVKPVLDDLGITSTYSQTPTLANLSRIWWCPTGQLAFLPIHAAGLYGKNDVFGSKLSDFVISSYTPSLTALIEGFRAPSKPQEAQLLAVAQPSAAGQSYIPGTKQEMKIRATADAVQLEMIDSGWVHFACHGVQNITHPTKSALLLAGSSRLTLSDIIELALPHADFAFLSACQTATGDKSLEGESVHLAAGMLLGWLPGYPTQAAEALHLAIRKLRERAGGKKSFFHWVPFIHIGV